MSPLRWYRNRRSLSMPARIGTAIAGHVEFGYVPDAIGADLDEPVLRPLEFPTALDPALRPDTVHIRRKEAA